MTVNGVGAARLKQTQLVATGLSITQAICRRWLIVQDERFQHGLTIGFVRANVIEVIAVV